MSPDWNLYVLKLIGKQPKWSHIVIFLSLTSGNSPDLQAALTIISTLRINISYKSQANMVYHMPVPDSAHAPVEGSRDNGRSLIHGLGTRNQAWELWTHRTVRCRGCVCLMGGGVKNILWSCYPDANRWLLLYHRLQVIVILIYTTSILIRNRRAKQEHIMGLKQSSTSTLNSFYACQMLKSMPQWLRWSDITFRVASIFPTRASAPKNSCITSPSNFDLRNPHPSRGGVGGTTWR